MLRLETISAGYAGTQVLWDVDLEAESGQMTVIIGPNGAGKSSILKVVTGLLPPTGGRVFFDDEDITEVPAYERPDLGIAACPEGRRLFRQLTAEASLPQGDYSLRARRHAEDRLAQVYALFPGIRPRATTKALRLR